MAKNRKYQSAAIRFAPALKAFLLCVMIGGAGVGYVWQKGQIHEQGKKVKARENRLAELREQNKKLSDQLAMLRSPGKLDARVRELNLGLAQPRQSSVVRLFEPVPSLKTETAHNVAARSNAAP